MSQCRTLPGVLAFGIFAICGVGGGEPNGQALLESYCLDCHSESAGEGGFIMHLDSIEWSDRKVATDWETAHQMIAKGIMPPPDADQPGDAERTKLMGWLDEALTKNLEVGGTPLRRLSRREYEATVARLIGLPNFQVPPGFPPDNRRHGFDNQGDSLVIAPPHLEAFAETAARIADQVFPPSTVPPEEATTSISADDLAISYSSACLIDGTMRLASSGANYKRHSTWPNRFEAPASGVYRIKVTASCSEPMASPVPRLRVESTAMTGTDANRHADFELCPEPQTLTCEIGLDRGATFRLWYRDGPFDYDDRNNYSKFLKSLFLGEPKLAAAWESVGDPARGGSGWERVRQALRGPLPERVTDEASIDDLVKRVAKNSVKTGETLVYKFFEEGPYIAIHDIQVSGPIEVYADKDQQSADRIRQRFLGPLAAKSDESNLRLFLDGFLTRAFRRKPDPSEIDRYSGLVLREAEKTGSFEQGLHLAVRTALLSPSFLYRSVGTGRLTDTELASRLAYFLTSGPPDEKLMTSAAAGRLGDPKVLRQQTRRLLREHDAILAKDFATGWLGLDSLDQLMPDTRLIRNFTAAHRSGMKEEVYDTFRYLLRENLPISEFIAPDFVITNEAVGWDMYQLEQFEPRKLKKLKRKGGVKGMQRVGVERGGRRGGLLSMPAVMAATANGVDTQPVLRGVWLLENIIGSPPPEPPKAVPALTPDTTGTSSPKERLAAHMAEESCASCHREIDPLGFVLENYDPIGRWRDHYPKDVDRGGERVERIDGSPIETSGTLPGGVDLQDVTDLKAWLADNPEPFANCFGEKLLIFATGRSLNYRERKIVHTIVRSQRKNDYRLVDLITALVDSQVFRTK